MAYNTIIQQGRFTSDGSNKIIAIRSDVDFMWTYNITEIAQQNDRVSYAYWQRGMPQGSGLAYTKEGGANTIGVNLFAAPTGFTLIDTTASPVGNAIAITGTGNATDLATIDTGDTGGLVDGSIVRLSGLNNNLTNIAGFDFEVDTIVAGVSFNLRYNLANVPGAAATAGFYRRIAFDPIFYPRNRYIVDMVLGATTEVFFSVTHGFTVGQELRFRVSADFGTTQIDGLVGTVIAVDLTTNSATVNIDSTAFTAFAWPTAAAGLNFTFAQAVPLGMDTGTAISSNTNILADATVNTGLIGMLLAGGVDTPAGDTGDIIYWTASKSFSVDNT
jgi:hypothetical protein